MALKSLPLSDVYALLEPGPVVLLTTADKTGRANVMTMSWHMMMEFTPPLVGCVVSEGNFSFKALRATKECVIAIPARRLAAKVVKVGNCSGRDFPDKSGADKFRAVGFTPLPAKDVHAPLVAEAFANLECRVVDTRMVARYNMFVLEVVRAWRDPAQKNPKTIHHQGWGRFAVDGRIITLKSEKA
ncbi:flavin reductase family protein [Ferrovibrio sp.]|uniref:flavin reductase family protein n=1 Tax=Ferrovibrio sp. TaxID=1917215 RepID=UPI0035B2CC8E